MLHWKTIPLFKKIIKPLCIEIFQSNRALLPVNQILYLVSIDM